MSDPFAEIIAQFEGKPAPTEWMTVAVTALAPGWRARFRSEYGAPITRPCPALLLQARKGGHVTPEFATRATFAVWDLETFELYAACDDEAFAGILAPGVLEDST